MSDFEIISVSLNDNILDIEVNDTSYWISKDENSSDIDLYNEVFPFHLIFKAKHIFNNDRVDLFLKIQFTVEKIILSPLYKIRFHTQ